jgi:hypothetical protein
MDIGADRLSFLGRVYPREFAVREVRIPPGDERPFDDDEWRDAIVVIEAGEIELECVEGSRYGFRPGDVLFLIGLPLRSIHNPGIAPVLLTAATRRLRVLDSGRVLERER